MSNETTLGVPAVEVTLDRPRRMTLTLAALRRMRQATGMGLEVFDTLGDAEMLDHMDGIVWATLAGDDPELTREQVAEMIHFGNLGMVSDALGELVRRSMPDPLDSEPEPKKPAKAKSKAKKTA